MTDTSAYVTDQRALDDATLVERIRAGESAAFEMLYERHKAPLFRTALAMTRDRSVAEELLQETFLRAFRHVGRVELAAGASLRPWLHRILINLTYDRSARERARPRPLEGVVDRLTTAPSLSPEFQTERHELQRVVGEAIARLPFKQRAVIVLFYLHDMDLQEIAATLSLPPGTVKSRLFYGRARLREQLEADSRLPTSVVLSYVST